MEEPSSSKRRDSGGNGPLTEWRRFEESEGTVTLYLSKVTSNCASRCYESTEEVFVDYTICNKLHIKLLRGKSKAYCCIVCSRVFLLPHTAVKSQDAL